MRSPPRADPKELAFREGSKTHPAAFADGRAGDHLEPDLIALHASGELPPEDSFEVTRHLGACDDGRCVALYRDLAVGVALARRALFARDESTDSSLVAQRQTERTFECPDDLWEAFGDLASTEDASIDFLVNEAMKQYAEVHRHARAVQLNLSAASVASPQLDPGGRASTPWTAVERNTPTLPRAYVLRPSIPPLSERRTLAPPPNVGHGAARPLSIEVEGKRVRVSKDRFVIGRGGASTDLLIDDPNVSRRHAMIERFGEAHFFVDLGSMNGVEFGGERVIRRPIHDGDVFRICDHELVLRYA